jgi:hypothetical protein
MVMKGIKGDLLLILKFKDCHRGNCEVISPSGSALVSYKCDQAGRIIMEAQV